MHPAVQWPGCSLMAAHRLIPPPFPLFCCFLPHLTAPVGTFCVSVWYHWIHFLGSLFNCQPGARVLVDSLHTSDCSGGSLNALWTCTCICTYTLITKRLRVEWNGLHGGILGPPLQSGWLTCYHFSIYMKQTPLSAGEGLLSHFIFVTFSLAKL